MDRALKGMIDRVLKEETKSILDEIDTIINKDGMRNALTRGSKKGDTKPGRNQFKSLMDAAGKASCVEELVLFLAYQNSKGNGWQNKVNKNTNIAEKITQSLMSITDKLSEIIETKPEAENMSIDDKRIMRLIIAEKYLGYLYWSVSALRKEEKNVS